MTKAGLLGPSMSRVWLLAFLAAAWLPTACSAETLFDAISLAYQSNPNLRAQQAQLRSLDEQYVQAKAGYGPQIGVTSQLDYQAARVQEPPSFFTAKTTTDYTAGNASADLSISQPIFTNGQVTAQVRGASAGVLAGREGVRQMESEVLLAVITAYMDVRRDRETADILKDEISTLQAEVTETEARGKLGAVSKTDVAQAEARLLSTQAQLSDAQGKLAVSDSEYLEVVGENPGDLAPEPALPGVPTSVDEAFDAADHNNAQVLGALESERSAREQVTQAKAAQGPTVALKVDAAIQPTEPFIPRQYDQSLTAAVVFNQPIFTSGLSASKVREAADDDARAAMNVEIARREVVQVVAQSWSQLVSARNSGALEQRQIGVEEVAAEGNRIEERVGLRTTVDMLNAESELASSRVAFVASHHDEYVAAAGLLSAMGLLEARYILPTTQLYDPVKSLNRVKNINAPAWEGAIAAVDASAPVKTAPPSALSDGAAAPPAMEQPQPETEGHPGW
jgi:outer membrane protein